MEYSLKLNVKKKKWMVVSKLCNIAQTQGILTVGDDIIDWVLTKQKFIICNIEEVKCIFEKWGKWYLDEISSDDRLIEECWKFQGQKNECRITKNEQGDRKLTKNENYNICVFFIIN